MMDTLFNQERVTEIHEKNLVWEGYNNGFAEGETKGRTEGRTEGENKLGTLISFLINSGRNDEIEKAASDVEYRQKLYAEFGIE